MKLIKKLLALLLVAFIIVGCSKPADDTKDPEVKEGETGTKDPGKEDPDKEGGSTTGKDTLVVAATAHLNGSFINGFGNSAYDAWVKNLLHGYGTYATDENGQFQLNTTVVDGEPKITENEDGSKTYQYKIKEGLKYNTGEEITAEDYVFSMLFGASPQWSQVGADNSSYSVYKGFAAYNSGETNKFEGVKLVDKMTFEITLAAEELPYFFEQSIASAGPEPMFRYTPGLAIAEDGQSLKLAEGTELTDAQKADFKKNLGIEIENAKEDVTEAQKALEDAKKKAEEDKEPLTAEEIKAEEEAISKLQEKVASLEAQLADFEAGKAVDATKTLLLSGAYDVKNNYRFKPDVTTGPYQFKLFENQSATVELNPNYAGNFQGKKPTIPRVEVRYVQDKLDVDLVISGDIDLAPGVTQADKINKAKENEEKVAMNNYNRNGYGLIHMLNDMEPTNHKGVRQAVAYLMDRNEFVQQMLGGYGEVVNGEFGISQWQYATKGDEFNEKIAERDTVYNLDTDKANEVLDTTPYKFEKDGVTPFDKAKAAELAAKDGENFNYWRYNDKKQVLQINHAGASEEVLNIITSQVPVNGRKVGLKYTTSLVDFNVMLDGYYGAKDIPISDRKYQSFSMATGFYPWSMPYWSMHSSQLAKGGNYDRINDPEVDRISDAMKKTDPSDVDGYAELWLEYQLWFNENLPNIPLYANQYFDIHTVDLEGLGTAPDWNWSLDIVNLKFK